MKGRFSSWKHVRWDVRAEPAACAETRLQVGEVSFDGFKAIAPTRFMVLRLVEASPASPGAAFHSVLLSLLCCLTGSYKQFAKCLWDPWEERSHRKEAC